MRFRVIRACYFIFVFLIIVRLFYWQIIKSDDLVALAEGQRVSSSEIIAPRGDILFSDGSTLATSQPSYLVFAEPKVIKDKVDAASKLAQIFFSLDDHTGEDPQTQQSELKDLENSLLGKMSQDLYWVSLGRSVDADTKKQIESLQIDGIGFDQSYARFYPEGSSSAHLLGFVANDAYGNRTGYFGLEGYYNGELRGQNGVITQEKDAQGLPILIGKYLSQDPKPGKTLVLNIDRTVQYIVEQNLEQGMQKYGAKAASAIVMDPKTGAVLALASYPNYDPANVTQYPKQYFTDQAIADSYEPGSTFKPLIMSAAFNEHLITPDTQCDICSGPVSVGGYEIHTWDNHYFPNTTMTDVIINSDNTGMVFVSRKLGLDKEYEYLQKYGIGQSTGIDLQDEATPDLRPKDEWHDIDVATAAFGQGVAVTPIQLVRAIATIANGGYLMEPQVVKQIKDQNGGIYNVSPVINGQPLSTDTAKTMTDIMVQEVDKGEAHWYKTHEGVGAFKIAGKTGTAQIPVAGHYDPTKTIASFVGFAPADNPKFIMLVRYDQPTASIYGADTAAPTFFDISRQLFNYYGITPDE